MAVVAEIEARFYLPERTSPAEMLQRLELSYPVSKIKDYAFTDHYYLPKKLTSEWHPDVQSIRIRNRTLWTGKESKPPANLIVTKLAGQEKKTEYEGPVDDLQTPHARLVDEGYLPWMKIRKKDGLHYEVGKVARIAMETVDCEYGKYKAGPFAMGELECSTADEDEAKRTFNEFAGALVVETMNESMAAIAMRLLRLDWNSFMSTWPSD